VSVLIFVTGVREVDGFAKEDTRGRRWGATGHGGRERKRGEAMM
jgi:hypothetical protein